MKILILILLILFPLIIFCKQVNNSNINSNAATIESQSSKTEEQENNEPERFSNPPVTDRRTAFLQAIEVSELPDNIFNPFNKVEASSTYQDDFIMYGAENLVDRRDDTFWAAGSDNDGIGEKIVFSTEQDSNEKADISGIIIHNGNLKSEEDYLSSGRLRSFMIITDESTYNVSLGDSSQWMMITLPEPVHTGKVEIAITYVFAGIEINKVCISEIVFF